jgi:hypothetical protein
MDEYQLWMKQKRISIRDARELHEAIQPTAHGLSQTIQRLERQGFSERDDIYKELSMTYEQLRRLCITLHYEATNMTGKSPKAE